MHYARLDQTFKAIDAGEYSIALVNAKLHRVGSARFGDSVECLGSGFFEWTQERGVEIRLLMAHGSQLFDWLFTGGLTMGQLVPSEFYFVLEATAQDGSRFVCQRIDPGNVKTYGNVEFADWRLGQRELLATVDVTRCSSSGESDETVVLFKCDFSNWTEILRHETRTVFGTYSVNQMNGVAFETLFGKVTVLKLPSGNLLATVKSSENNESDNHDRMTEAVRMAFSFMTGRSATVIASGRYCMGEKITRLNYPLNQPRNCLFRPGGTGSSPDAVMLLSKAASYFWQDDGQVVANHIFNCMEASDSGLNSFAFSLCSAIEGVAKHILQVEHIQVENVLKQWERAGRLQLSENDRKSWRCLRHVVAHGGLIDRNRGLAIADAVNHLGHVKSLLLRLLLACIGYEGRYIEPQNSILADFQAVSLNQLRADAGTQLR